VIDQFETVTFDKLNQATAASLDDLPFGIIRFGEDYLVNAYNAFEAANAGLSPSRVIGKHVFEEVAPCMNNFMVAQRFADEAELDAIIPYVLTLRMRPTRVRLRLIKAAHGNSRLLLVDRNVA
jgi:photoactive yellow protein